MVELIWVETLGAMVETVLLLEGETAGGTGGETEGTGMGTMLGTGRTSDVPVLLA